MRNSTQAQLSVSRQSQLPAPVEKSFPERLFDCLTAYKRSAAIKAAIDLDLFTAVAEGMETPEALALRLQASTRGVRILCDYLTVQGFLGKGDGRYSLPPDVSKFLDRHSPAYIGSVANFLAHPMLTERYRDLAACVRKGGAALADFVEPEHPVWAEFARSMAPVAAINAELLVALLGANQPRTCKVLDVAAGHGLFGITLARHNSKAEVVAVDWKNVLPVARENARTAGVSARYSTIEGSAFNVDFGEGFDLVLLTNFLHHFSPAANESLLHKVHRALGPRGRAVVLEFVPNPDRVTPAAAAEFSLTMLASTPDGDAYTYRELEDMFRNAGFASVEPHELPPSFQRVVIGTK